MITKTKSPWDTSSPRWDAPFVLALMNAEVAAWSHALRSNGKKESKGDGNSATLRTEPAPVYREVAVLPDFKTAFVSHFGFIMFSSLLFNPFTRFLLKKYALPKPGEGPGLGAMENEHYLSVLGEGVGVRGNRVRSTMYFPKDAGYMETARMLVEAGLALALDEKSLPKEYGGGFWTPSTALGDVLMKRLLDTGTTYEYQVVKTVSTSDSTNKKKQ